MRDALIDVLNDNGWTVTVHGNKGRGRVQATLGARWIVYDFKNGFAHYATWSYYINGKPVASNYSDGCILSYLALACGMTAS
jgi:hypothetical protein